MVQVPDQFETTPRSQYSGSYTDDVFIPGMSIFKRRPVYYSAANPTPLPPLGDAGTDVVVYRNLANHTGSLAAIKGRLTLNRQAYGSVAGRSATNVMRKFRSETEIFTDSVLPAPTDIYLINGGQFVEGDDYNPTSSLSPESISKTPRKFLLCLGTNLNFGSAIGTPSLTSSTDTSQVSDNLWAYSFPFENRYAGLERYATPGFKKEYLVKLTQSADAVAGAVVATTNTTGPWFSGSVYSLQYLHKDGFGTQPWAYGATLHNQIIATNPVGTVITGVDVKSTTYGRIEEIMTGFFGFLSQGGNRSFLRVPEASAGGVPTRFNPGKYPGWLATADFDGRMTNHFVQGIRTQLQVNGWKQGVYHALPQKSHCYFRYNHFGHFRDMFEQRPITKYHDGATGRALESPVIAVFVSGSGPFVTASRPTELNPNVSGIYDKEGKMGKPFDDSPSGSI